MLKKPPRKFHICTYNHTHTVFEILPRGQRAVSPCYADKIKAEDAMKLLNEDNTIARVYRGQI